MARALQLDSDRIRVTDKDLGIGDAETGYVLKPITREVYKRIRQDNTKRMPNRQTRGMEDVTDWEAFSEDLLDYTIESWSGVLVGGEPAPCDRDHKLALDLMCATALMNRAGLNDVEREGERKAESFRPPSSVR